MKERSIEEMLKVDRKAIKIGPIDEKEELEFWLSRPYRERLNAIELMRRIAYGHARATARLQRVIEIISGE